MDFGIQRNSQLTFTVDNTENNISNVVCNVEYKFLTYLKAERISAVSNNKLKLFDIKWKDWKKYISIK